MHGKQKKNNRFVVAIVMAITCVLTIACPAMAEDLTGSLTVCYCLHEGEYVKQIDGAEFSLYQIADYDASLKITSYCGEHDFYNMSADQMSALAGELSDKAVDPIITGVTDEKGIIAFTDLDTGIYLVKQTGRQGGSTYFENALPFIVSIPSEDGYDVICYPKTTAKPKDNAILPKTGDGLNLQGAVVTLAFGGAILAGILLSTGKKGGGDIC